jgi:chitodextrinase
VSSIQPRKMCLATCRSALLLMLVCGSVSNAASIEFFSNAPAEYDYLRQSSVPAGFGSGEFTLEIWLRLDEESPVGSTSSGAGQRTNWTDANPQPYSSSSWWYTGNFLLDGHNNANAQFENGTFSLQVFNGGRIRWLFGDGSAAAQRGGRVHAVQNGASDSLLDGEWHQVTLVRRSRSGGATLEMWIDGASVASESTSSMADMQQWWNGWNGYPANQSGWFWGTEKQAALRAISQYEDYKGNIDELRFWSRAKTADEIQTAFRRPVTGAESGLVGWYTFQDQSLCNQINDSACMSAVALGANARSSANAPLADPSDTTAPSAPTSIEATPISSTQINLTWNASSDNVAVVDYRITRNGVVLTQRPNSTSFSDTGLTPATTYTYSVAARDAIGNVSTQSASVDITTPPSSGGTGTDTTPPTTPTGLTGSALSSTRIDLSWTASTDNVAVEAYRITRNGVVISSGTAGTTFSDTALSPTTSYTYSVAARDAAGNFSSESTAVVITTASGGNTGGGGGGGGGSFGGALLIVGLLSGLGRRHLLHATKRNGSLT